MIRQRRNHAPGQSVKTNLRNIKAAAEQHVTSITHEVQEGAVRGLVDLEAAWRALPLGRAGHSAALVVDHEGVQLAVPLTGHCLLEVLSQTVHQILHMQSSHGSVQVCAHLKEPVQRGRSLAAWGAGQKIGQDTGSK